MYKFKKFIVFFWKKCSFENKIRIIKTIFGLPAGMFHELCHIIMIFLFFGDINHIRCSHFYKVTGYTLYTWEFTVNWNYRYKLQSFLVSIAPLVGILGSYFISPYLLLYLLVFYQESILSEQDFNNIKELIKPEQKKLQYILNKSKKVICFTTNN